MGFSARLVQDLHHRQDLHQRRELRGSGANLRLSTLTGPDLARSEWRATVCGLSVLYFTEHTEVTTEHAFPAEARHAVKLRRSASVFVAPRPKLTSPCFVSAIAPH